MVIIEMDDQFQQRFDQMLSRLKENSLRITPQRLAVLKILASSSEHPTEDQRSFPPEEAGVSSPPHPRGNQRLMIPSGPV